MSLDPTTETIAHFVGIFHVAVEEARMRQAYDAFEAQKAAAPDLEPKPLVEPELNAAYALKPYDPQVSYVPTAVPLRNAEAGSAPSAPADFGLPVPSVPHSLNGPDPWLGPIAGPVMILPYVPIPSSVVTFTRQEAILFDVDVLGAPRDMLDVESQLGALMSAANLARVIGGIEVDELTALTVLTEVGASALAEEMAAFAPVELDGVSAYVASGDVLLEAMAGTALIDGVAVEADEIPEFNDMRPAYVAEKYDDGDEDEADAPADETTAEDGKVTPWDNIREGKTDAELEAMWFDKNDPDTPSPWKVEDGHRVVTGANEATNEAFVTTSWIDAGVIGVGGDVTRLTTVSQTNVLSDRDGLEEIAEDAQSEAQNVFVSSRVSDRLEEIEEAEEGDAPEPPEGLPETWNLERYEGDVISINSVSQFTFALDGDYVAFSIGASATFLGTGENLLFNAAYTLEIGFGYDLIIVGGNFIEMTAISQTNVLLDDDDVTLGDGLHASVSGSDNALVNKAVLEKHGLDEMVEMQKNMADAIESLAEGAGDLGKALAQDPLFTGLSALKALYISGDLIKVTAISQVNVVGDQDKVSLALDDFLSTGRDAVEIVTGSNALINNAKVVDIGYDSKVMAGGEVYDDALLYQAELIDTDAAPLETGVAELANEAVAFLADGMLSPEDLIEAGHASAGGDGGQMGAMPMDVMQSMTA